MLCFALVRIQEPLTEGGHVIENLRRAKSKMNARAPLIVFTLNFSFRLTRDFAKIEQFLRHSVEFGMVLDVLKSSIDAQFDLFASYLIIASRNMIEAVQHAVPSSSHASSRVSMTTVQRCSFAQIDPRTTARQQSVVSTSIIIRDCSLAGYCSRTLWPRSQFHSLQPIQHEKIDGRNHRVGRFLAHRRLSD